MGGIVKISKLGLPNGKVIGVIDWVAVFVWHGCILWETTVENLYVSPAWALFWEKVQRIKWALIFLIDQVKMPLGKGSSLNVLSSHPDIESFIVQRKKSKGLTSCPVVFVLFNRFQTLINMVLLNSGMDGKWRGVKATCFSKFGQQTLVHSCWVLLTVLGRLETTPLFRKSMRTFVFRISKMLQCNLGYFLALCKLSLVLLKLFLSSFLVKLSINKVLLL